MPVPFREFSAFDLATLIGHDTTDFGFDHSVDWTTTHNEAEMVFGAYLVTNPPKDGWYWRAIIRPPGASFALLPGADELYDWGIRFNALIKVHAGGATPNCEFFVRTFTAANAWDPDTVTGRHYNGANNWPGYPSPGTTNDMRDFAVLHVDLPKIYAIWTASQKPGYAGNDYQDEFIRNGILIYAANWGGGGWPGMGEDIEYEAEPDWIRIRVINPIVNSITPATTAPGTTPTVILAGLGFDNSDADLSDAALHPSNAVPAGGWNDEVDLIYIIDITDPSTIVDTLNGGLGDFTIDNNGQITIPAMPALPNGTYWFILKKEGVGLGGIDAEGYAGDWRADPTGLLTAGTRLTYTVTTAPPPIKKKKIVPITRWKFKKFDGTILYKYYAPIDTRGPLTFYEGRILSISSFSRALNDISGLADVSDISIEMANQDKEFSKLLAEYHTKGQPVEIYMAWADDPETIKSAVCKFIVDDYDRPGLTWKVKLKDISQKYMKRRIPTEICSLAEYPNIWSDHIGKAKPVPLGFCQHTTGEAPGAVEAIYIDTIPGSAGYQYLASMDTINIVGVYSDGAGPMAPGTWSQGYGPFGETYLFLVNDQADNKITFNCEGPGYSAWNGPGGFIQNPAYIILYLLINNQKNGGLEIPPSEIDLISFDDMAIRFSVSGADYSTHGFFIAAERKDAGEYLRELCFTYGVAIYPAKDGRLTIGKLDLSNYSAALRIFEQIDVLEEPARPMNMARTINSIKMRWQFYPQNQSYYGSKMVDNPASIAAFEMTAEALEEWTFPWTDSEPLADERALFELARLSYGNRKLVFQVHLSWLDNLDLLDTFIYQEPFAIDISGGIAEGLFYVEGLDADFQNFTLTITGVDLDWLLNMSI